MTGIQAQAGDTGDWAVVVLRGELDVADRRAIVDRVDDELARNPAGIALDLSGVTFLDSTALGALLHCRNRCVERGVELVLRTPSQRVLRVLDVSGTTEIFRIER